MNPPMKYLFATNNQGKVKEIKSIFQKAGLEVISLADLGLAYEPSETGSTFEDNAIQKATKTARFLRENSAESNIAVLSDDSGLCVDALGGLPGVESANFMGRETPYEMRNNRIVEMLAAVPRAIRIARFECVIACVFPGGDVKITTGKIEGLITNPSRGKGGFGYDPIFFVPEFGKTMADLTQHEKNSVSHRGKALGEMIEILKSHIDSQVE